MRFICTMRASVYLVGSCVMSIYLGFGLSVIYIEVMCEMMKPKWGLLWFLLGFKIGCYGCR